MPSLTLLTLRTPVKLYLYLLFYVLTSAGLCGGLCFFSVSLAGHGQCPFQPTVSVC